MNEGLRYGRYPSEEADKDAWRAAVDAAHLQAITGGAAFPRLGGEGLSETLNAKSLGPDKRCQVAARMAGRIPALSLTVVGSADVRGLRLSA